jgi:hypothetical protein
MQTLARSMTPRTSGLLLQRKCGCGGACRPCAKDEKRKLQRVATGTRRGEAPPIVGDVLAESGRPLDMPSRAMMEPRFGHDFSGVRIHSGARASQSAQAVDALAYAVGNHVVIDESRWPSSGPSRDRMLAHELTHVVQQSSGAVTHDRTMPLRIGGSDDPLEHEADSMAQGVVGGAATSQGDASGVLRRQKGQAKPEKEGAKNCGPNMTGWLVHQMNKAKSNPDVLQVKLSLAMARTNGVQAGVSSLNALEDEVRTRVIDAADRAGNPPLSGKAAAQIEEAGKHPSPTPSWFSTQPDPYGSSFSPAGSIAGMDVNLYDAATTWESLVGHNKVFDFKNNVLTKPQLEKYGCSNPCGKASVTLCKGCYRSDVPGNLFYAAVGKFAGFSLNVLQLGSQYAQLTPSDGKSPHWDPPDDTALIDAGYNLPANLTYDNFCDAVPSLPATEPCAPCAMDYRPAVVKS